MSGAALRASQHITTFYYISSHRSSHIYIIHTAYLGVVFKISRGKQLEAASGTIQYNALFTLQKQNIHEKHEIHAGTFIYSEKLIVV